MSEIDAYIAERQPGLDQRSIDPRYLGDGERKPAPVWAESQALREILDIVRDKRTPDAKGLDRLREALTAQLPTLQLFRHIAALRDAVAKRTAASPDATLYLIVFPGEGRDRTGIKDLNDKVLGYEYCSQFIRQRQELIRHIFKPAGTTGPAFTTVGQDYKTATIIAVGKSRKDFKKELERLDAELRTLLLKVLKDAEDDKDTPNERRVEIRKLRKALKKNYRFDFIFGATTRRVSEHSAIDVVFLLITEALKAAGVARFIAKATAVQKASGTNFAPGKIASSYKPKPDSKALDERGKEFDWNDFMRSTEAAQEVRTVMSSELNDDSMITDYIHIFVNGVWTFPFVMFDPPDERRLIANSDVVRDARKRVLAEPKMRGEGVKHSFGLQVLMLELWLVSINIIDLIKDFLVPEFRSTLMRYHAAVSASWDDLEDPWTGIKDPARLERVLTRDLRQRDDPLPVQGRASEFQFYSYTSDYPDRIFFVMDVRDLGVDLMVPYELSNDAIHMRKLAGVKLMEETFWSSDPINRRKRATYDAVVEVFRTFHALPHPDWRADVIRAFGTGTGEIDPVPAFPQSVQIMMGGDEIFVAAHPGYAGRETAIIKALDGRSYDKIPLNLRAAVVYSSAKRAPPATPSKQRELNVKAHDQALALAGEAPETLKGLERTQRRIERLIDKLVDNPKKQKLADPYRKELAQLGLVKVYARAKHFHAAPLSAAKFSALMGALKKGDPKSAHRTGNFDLVDFSDKEVNLEKLTQAAQKLEDRIRRDVGRDNYHVDPPLLPKLKKNPLKYKVPKWLKELLPEKFKRLIEEWLEDDGQKNQATKVFTA